MLNVGCLRMCSSWRRPLNAVCKTFNVNVKQERQARDNGMPADECVVNHN
jgi:hypothetical protein